MNSSRILFQIIVFLNTLELKKNLVSPLTRWTSDGRWNNVKCLLEI